MIDMNVWGIYPDEKEEREYMKAVKYRKRYPTKYTERYYMTKQEADFFKEMLANGFDKQRAYASAYGKLLPAKGSKEFVTLGHSASAKLNNPVIKFALKTELQQSTGVAEIDEGYLTNALLELEYDSKGEGDRKSQLGVYKLLMQLKGMGKTTVENINIEKSEFSMMDSKELKGKLVEAVRILVTNGQLDIDEFIDELREGVVMLGTGSKVKVV